MAVFLGVPLSVVAAVLLLAVAHGQVSRPYEDGMPFGVTEEVFRGGLAAVGERLSDGTEPLVMPRGAEDTSIINPQMFEVFNLSTTQGVRGTRNWHARWRRVINNQLVHGHYFVVEDAMKSLSFNEPLNGCPGFIRTSVSAERAGCSAAMNGGFFDIHTGQCLGHLIQDSRVVAESSLVTASFGITKSGLLISGYLTKKDISMLAFKHLISGQTWLIRNRMTFLNESVVLEATSFDFVWIKAPRTAIGHDKDGRIWLIEVDGDEYLHKGLDLAEWAEVVRSFGLVNAVNMDGGGSSAVWHGGKTINKYSDHCPTVLGHRCERPVTSYFCIRGFVSES